MGDESFKAIPRDICETCSRPTEDYYRRRAEHMSSAFRSGVPIQGIARAYYVSPQWAMTIVTEQMGKEAVLEIQATYWAREEE